MTKSISIDKSLFTGLKETLLQTPETPVQQVSVIKKTKEKSIVEEAPFTLWIPKDLMKKIKLKAVETDTTIKEIILEGVKKNI